ncbi:hypothetical protein L861_06670 [Litchfieldella anticariensis FP35 = DSM 16096]|uniref:cyclic-guanylate-specific phosphodiesterase n=1 Tax=Litchfieldella anticariensis (strain DSM 16096 / CECT 5854 / CIP 108499 / LMG 22089 / FP35) TaxID=1121939 RepID=S2KJN8_LITA3|nr:EAL domain-containing protein [Halomonas anticariensis]EPC00618.1 hypothetical protein L861_06670 [Halomonas anticariensis FP35 = DSM 16096]
MGLGKEAVNRQLAFHTTLLMLIVGITAMGGLGSLSVLYLDNHPHIFPLSPQSAVAGMLTGMGLLATLLGTRLWRRLITGVLLVLVIYALAMSSVATGMGSGEFLSHIQGLLAMASVLPLLLIMLCLWIGLPGSGRSWFWQFAGVLIGVIGLVMLAADLFLGQPNLWLGVPTQPSIATMLQYLLLGSAMGMMGSRPNTQGLMLKRPAIVAGVLGVLVSFLCWLLLSWQQHQGIIQRAEHLMDNIQLIVEHEIIEREQFMRRMAERWSVDGGLPSKTMREQEAYSYLRDTPSLKALAFLDAEHRSFWRKARTGHADALLWLDDQLLSDDVSLWLETSGNEAQWRFPDPARPAMALLSLPLPNTDGHQLISSQDLAVMLQSEVRAAFSPFSVHVHRQGEELFELADRGHEANHSAHGQEALAELDISLSGGPQLHFAAFESSLSPFGLAALLPLGVGVTGLTLTYLLTFSLGLSAVSLARSQKLAAAKQQLEAQHHIQSLIAQEAPLHQILEAVCHMVERQSPGALCSIMLSDETQQTLDRIISVSLPQAYQKVVKGLAIGPSVGACGSAAYQHETVICSDLTIDPRWEGYRDIALEHGLHACWSYPVMATNNRLLGTFAVYHRHPGEPTALERRLILEAAELVALAVGRHVDRQTLWANKQRYRSLFTYHPDAVYSLDEKGHFVSVNPAGSAITGFAESQILGKHFSHFVEEADQARVQSIFEDALSGMPQRFQARTRDVQGEVHVLDVVNLPIVINDRISGVYGIAKDITERKQQETQLRILQRSLEGSVNGVVIADAGAPELPIIYTNEAFTRITGYGKDEALGHNCRFLQGPESESEAVGLIRHGLTNQQEVRTTLRNYRKDGTPFWNDLYIAPVRDESGKVTHFVGVQNDISEHKAYEARLAYHANHDALTGLANRTLLEDRLTHDIHLTLREGRMLAVLFIDLDDVKMINDSLGHGVGDKLIIAVAKRLTEEMRPGDTLARFGGDEFVVLLPELEHEEAAMKVAEQLLATIARPYRLGVRDLYVTASIGLAFSSDEIEHPLVLIQQANLTVSKVKKQGGNGYRLYSGEISAQARERLTLRHDLQAAIEARQFEVHYQPLVRAEDGRITGFEALLRWKHPSKGYISPAVFIPLAEDTGQIIPISEWVLRQACHDLQQLGDDYRVAVNLSPMQFHRSDFLSTLQRTHTKTGLAPGRLELELTEGILMEDTETAIGLLRQLRDMGIKVALDDFGTGFSSLSYLKNLPIDKLKIDRSFVLDVANKRQDAGIVQGIIDMAHHLELTVVAEGIETVEQRDTLRALGCDLLQGYLFAKPMPLAELRTFLETSG